MPTRSIVEPEALGGSAGLSRLRSLGVAFVVVKRYNNPDPATLPFLDAWRRRAGGSPCFHRTGRDAAAEQARVEPFLHNTDTRIDGALERPGPLLEIWQLEWLWLLTRHTRTALDVSLRESLRTSVARLRESLKTRARALPSRATRGRATAGAGTSSASSASSRKDRPRRSAADGRRLRSDDAVQPALRVLLRRRPAEHRRRVAAGADARGARARRSRTSPASRSASPAARSSCARTSCPCWISSARRATPAAI